jgi:hypothetical protein
MDVKETAFLKRSISLFRMLFLASASFIVAGGSIQGVNSSESLLQIGQDLVKAGYIIVAFTTVSMIIFHIYLYKQKNRYPFSRSSKLVGQFS